MGVIKGLYNIGEEFCTKNFGNGELWKHFPAYVALAVGGYFLGSGGCSKINQLEQKAEQQAKELKEVYKK